MTAIAPRPTRTLGRRLEIAAAELLAATNYPEIVRCVQFPRGLMFFLLHLETTGLPRFTFIRV